MTKEELLIRRFEVISPYPECEKHGFKVGDILTDDGKNIVKNQKGRPSFAFEWRAFPAIFKELEWWEKRKREQLPEYVRYIDGRVFKLSDVTKCYSNGFTIEYPMTEFDVMFSDCIPASKEEYEYYHNVILKDQSNHDKAKALAAEAVRMLPDSCKEIMGESLIKTYKESLVEDIKHAFIKS